MLTKLFGKYFTRQKPEDKIDTLKKDTYRTDEECRVFGDTKLSDISADKLKRILESNPDLSDDLLYKISTQSTEFIQLVLSSRITTDRLNSRLLEFDTYIAGMGKQSRVLRMLIETQPFNLELYTKYINIKIQEWCSVGKPAARIAIGLLPNLMHVNEIVMVKINEYLFNKIGRTVIVSPKSSGITLTREESIMISKDMDLPLDVLMYTAHQLNWYWISRNQGIDINTPTIFLALADLDAIAQYRKLDEDFIVSYKNKLNPTIVCRFQELSSDFLAEFSEWVNWEAVAKYQNLSMDTIREWIEKLDYDLLLSNNNIDLNMYQIKEIYSEAYLT